MGAVEGVRVCLCVAETGSKHHKFGGQPHVGGALLTDWLLGRPGPHLHPVCYVQKHPHTYSQGTAGDTVVSHCVAHQGSSQHGVLIPDGQEVSAWCIRSTGEGRSCPTLEWPFLDAISAPKDPCCACSPTTRAVLMSSCPARPLLPPLPGHFYKAYKLC